MNTFQSNLSDDAGDVIGPLRKGVDQSVTAAKNSRTLKIAQKKMRQTGANVRDEIEEIDSTIHHFIDSIRARSKSAKSAVNELVHEHPYAAAGIAFSVGVVIAGALLNRARQ